jgi:hypothetical protein
MTPLRAWWYALRQAPAIINDLNQRLLVLENVRLPMLERVVYKGNTVVQIPIPNGWSVEQSWEVFKRSDDALFDQAETAGSTSAVVMVDSQGNLLKVYE